MLVWHCRHHVASIEQGLPQEPGATLVVSGAGHTSLSAVRPHAQGFHVRTSMQQGSSGAAGGQVGWLHEHTKQTQSKCRAAASGAAGMLLCSVTNYDGVTSGILRCRHETIQ